MNGDATKMNIKMVTPATIPDNRKRPFDPFVQLSTLIPIVAPPPIVPKIPEMKFPIESAMSC